MEDDLKNFKMEDDLKNFKMEDDLKDFEMEDDLKISKKVLGEVSKSTYRFKVKIGV